VELIATGDAIVTRGLAAAREPGVLEIRELLRGADVGFTNLEMALPDYPATPAALPRGSHLAGHRGAVPDLTWLGVTVCNMANNHATDYSTSGLEAALATVERAGLPYAGAGRSLAAARAPCFVDTPAGRFALIGVSSSNADFSLAADPAGVMAGRTGINPLRFGTAYEVTHDQLRQLRAMDEQLGTAAAREARVSTSRSRSAPTEGGTLSFADRRFVATDGPPRVTTRAHPGDLDATVRAVAYARSQADVVAVSVHCHEGAADGWNSPGTPDFLVQAAHAWVDAGADVVIGHGPHQLRGVEMYGGRPILYSVGNFVFTTATVPVLPPEAYEKQGLDPRTSTVSDYADAAAGGGFPAHAQYWRAVIARLRFDGGGPAVDLLPIALGQHLARHRRGMPALADATEGTAILAALDELSKPFGTTLSVTADGGRVKATLT
jgi:poly-gamma-glutamate synthesis protein (capsule biosynthesis protein)